MVAWVSPTVAAPMTGGPGTVAGVTLFDMADGALLPTALVAVTVKAYAVPLAKPITLIEVHGATQLPAMPDGAEIAVYPLIVAPPLLAGAVKVMIALALPGVADTPVGGSGTTAFGVNMTADDALPVPTVLIAFTLQVYSVPLVSAVTVSGLPTPVAVFDPGVQLAT